MIEIKILGRAGQGVVTLSQLLAIAAFHDKKYSQAFPMFGSERRGAPVKAFVRISNEKINLRSQIYNPDYTIILDDSLTDNTKSKQTFLNTKKKIKNAVNCENDQVNTAMLAYFIKKTNLISLSSLLKAVDERFKGEIALKNKQTIKKYFKK